VVAFDVYFEVYRVFLCKLWFAILSKQKEMAMQETDKW